MAIRLKDDIDKVASCSQTLDILFKELGIQTLAGRQFVVHALANAMLFDRKQQDYGPRNISGFGTFGVIVRMNDKHERLKTLFTKKSRRRTAVAESVEDTLRDVCNYAIIATMLERNEWPTS